MKKLLTVLLLIGSIGICEIDGMFFSNSQSSRTLYKSRDINSDNYMISRGIIAVLNTNLMCIELYVRANPTIEKSFAEGFNNEIKKIK